MKQANIHMNEMKGWLEYSVQQENNFKFVLKFGDVLVVITFITLI